MSSLWDPVFIKVLERTGPLMLNLSETPYSCLFCAMEFAGLPSSETQTSRGQIDGSGLTEHSFATFSYLAMREEEIELLRVHIDTVDTDQALKYFTDHSLSSGRASF
jgi:hypothetical protein